MLTEIPVLDKGFVRLEAHMGTDLTVVNAARVSFAKRSEWKKQTQLADPFVESDLSPTGQWNNRLENKDEKLIRYLAKHKHWTPFAHTAITLHFKLPIFVARQLMKSNVGVVYNEVSRRYVDTPPEFHEPVAWRGRPEGSIKQGSSNNEIRVIPNYMNEAWEYPAKTYEILIKAGVAPEQARMVLPQSMYTEVWATMSLAAAARIFLLRSESYAQWEIQQYADAMKTLIEPLFSVSWKALTTKEPANADA